MEKCACPQLGLTACWRGMIYLKDKKGNLIYAMTKCKCVKCHKGNRRVA